MADGHGTKGTVCKLLLHHKYDWVMIVVLGIIEIILSKVIHPFQRFIGKDMMTDIMYPRKSNTVPIWAVGVVAGVLPVIVFTCFFARRRNLYDLHHGILGLVFSLLITGVITDSVKNAVGRPRPDFFWRCFPDGVPLFDSKFGDVVCNGDRKIINEGHKSFPSGHTSWSFSGLAFLSLYLAAKMKAFDKRGHAGKVCIAFLPLLVAVFIGISRVDDYRHHWQDVFAGGLIGFVVSALCYMQYFPAPFGSEGLGPFAYLSNHGDVHESSCEISTELNVI